MDGYGVRLRQSRERVGWSQLDLATRAGVSQRTVQRVEAGHDPNVDTAAALHAALVGRTPGLNFDMRILPVGATVGRVNRREFMAVSAIVPATLALRMIAHQPQGTTPLLDDALLDVWEARTENFAAARALEPPRLLLPQIEQHLMVLESLIDQHPGPERLAQRLWSIAAGTNAVAAWVSLMAEHRREMRDYLARGEALAREAGDNDTLVLLLMLRSDLLSPVLLGGDGGFPEQAIRALDEAMALSSDMTPLTLRVPVILRAAEEHAFVGNAASALRLLELGAEAQESSRIREHSLRRRWPAWSWSSYAGSAYNLLGRARDAIETLRDIRSPYPSHQPLLAADLGAAHAQAGNLDEATRSLGEALRLAMEHGYPEAARRVQGVRRRHLVRWSDEPRVRDLDEAISAIL